MFTCVVAESLGQVLCPAVDTDDKSGGLTELESRTVTLKHGPTCRTVGHSLIGVCSPEIVGFRLICCD